MIDQIKNHSFLLDISSSSSGPTVSYSSDALRNELTKYLQLLGGVIKVKLDKNIKYYVTDRYIKGIVYTDPETDLKYNGEDVGGGRSGEQKRGVSFTAKNMVQQSSSLKSKRIQKIVEKGKEMTSNAAEDPLFFAQDKGIIIYHAGKYLQYLQKYYSSVVPSSSSSLETSHSRRDTSKLRRTTEEKEKDNLPPMSPKGNKSKHCSGRRKSTRRDPASLLAENQLTKFKQYYLMVQEPAHKPFWIEYNVPKYPSLYPEKRVLFFISNNTTTHTFIICNCIQWYPIYQQ